MTLIPKLVKKFMTNMVLLELELLMIFQNTVQSFFQEEKPYDFYQSDYVQFTKSNLKDNNR